MEKWQNFEERIYKYLSKMYEGSKIEFKLMGGSVSNESDILVRKNNQETFYIEIKMPIAQSGQFVVLDNEKEFYYSPRNEYPIDEYSRFLIETINIQYDKYKIVGTNAIPICLDQTVFADWIIKHYQQKNVKYVATEYHDEYVILPIDRYGTYFNIAASLRRKKSGSGNLPQVYQSELMVLLKQMYENIEATIKYDKKQAYLYTKTLIEDKQQIFGENNIYLLNIVETGKYLIRKLSKTNNPNVIFTIEAKIEQKEEDLQDFKKELEDDKEK